VATLLALLAWPPGTALATFHVMQVREVYPGSTANPDSEYVELQMWAADQNLVAGHVLRSYDAAGDPVSSAAFAANVPDGVNQSTLLLATPQAESQFGVAADASLAAGSLAPGGGAVCWEAIDCVAWGSFSGTLPSPAGAPAAAAGIPDGMALRRSISRGCPTALDFEDDRDDSAADFSAVFPAPRPNAVAPTEIPCGGGGPGGGAGGRAPDTFLRGKPRRRTRDRTPTFRFGASVTGARFECKLDRRPFRSCRSPFTARPRLRLGRHRFAVRATDAAGRTDPTPARYRFRVLRRR
jgi:hypothetical protein